LSGDKRPEVGRKRNNDEGKCKKGAIKTIHINKYTPKKRAFQRPMARGRQAGGINCMQALWGKEFQLHKEERMV